MKITNNIYAKQITKLGKTKGSAKFINAYANCLASTSHWVPIELDRDALKIIKVFVCKFRG